MMVAWKFQRGKGDAESLSAPIWDGHLWSFFASNNRIEPSVYINGGGLGGDDDNEMRDDSSCSNSRKKERETQWCGGEYLSTGYGNQETSCACVP